MAFTKITNSELNNHGVRGLPDTPSLSAYDMQSKFDELSVEVIAPAVNRLVDELAETTAAANIGVEVPQGMSADNNLQAVLNNFAGANHSHDNKDTLDKLSEDDENHLLFDGQTIASKSFAKVIVGDQEIDANIDDVLKFFSGDNVELVPNVAQKSITVNMAHANENVFVRYSAYADGHDFVITPSSATPYMGLAITFSDTAPTNPSDYHWIQTGIETQDVPIMTVNFNTGNLEYSGTTYTFYTDDDGFLRWGVE